MKKVLLGTAVLLALLTGCSDEKKAPEDVQTSTQDEQRYVTAIVTPSNEDIEKDDPMPVLLNPSDEEMDKEDFIPKEGEEELPVQDEEPVEQEQGK